MKEQILEKIKSVGAPRGGVNLHKENILISFRTGDSLNKNAWVIYSKNKSNFEGFFGDFSTGKKESFFVNNSKNGDVPVNEKFHLGIIDTVFNLRAKMVTSKTKFKSHPFLDEKCIKKCQGMAVDKNNNLLIPLSINGDLVGIQLIKKEDGITKIYAVKGSAINGAYFPVGGDKKKIYIGRNIEDVCCVSQSTKNQGIYAPSGKTFSNIVAMMRSKFPDAEIIILAENESGNSKNFIICDVAARLVNAKIILPGYIGKINDALAVYGDEKKLDLIIKSTVSPDDLIGDGIPDGFVVSNDGIYLVGTDKSPQGRLICQTPIRIKGDTHDIEGKSWGRVIDVEDRGKRIHRVVLPASAFSSRVSDAIKLLMDEGAVIIPGQEKKISEYIVCCNPKKYFLCSTHLGWLDNNFRRFVMPKKVVGESIEEVMYQTEHAVFNPYEEKGNLEEWSDGVSSMAIGNPLMVLALSCAFTGPLLKILGKESFGIHIFGESSIGKSTTASLAGSVWGNPHIEGYLQTWRSTSAALEETASIYNDNILILDEVGVIDNPKDLQRIVFMLSGGQSKGRSNAVGGLRERKTWRIVFFSTGNSSISEMVRSSEGGNRINHAGGQMVRRIEVPVSKNGLEIFNIIHGAKDKSQFAKKIIRRCLDSHGVAGLEFLKKLIENRANVVGWWLDFIKSGKQIRVIAELSKNGMIQQIRVFSHFQLMAFAGKLATEFGITKWMVADVAEDAAIDLFNEWLKENSGHSSEKKELIKSIREVFHSKTNQFSTHEDDRVFSEQLGHKRVVRISDGRPAAKDDKDKDQIQLNQDGSTCMGFLITPTIFEKRFCFGNDKKSVIRWLKEENMYVNKIYASSLDGENRRYYVLRDKIEVEK